MVVLQRFSVFIISAIALFTLIKVFFPEQIPSYPVTTDGEIISTDLSSTAPPTNNFAYFTFLSEPCEDIKPDEEDFYYMGVRMIIYQILHNPETKSVNNYPVVVMVTKGVSQEKRNQMIVDGAILEEVEDLKTDWIAPGRTRWVNAMCKLNIFRMTQYDRVIFLDSDQVIVRPIDEMFVDPAAVVTQNKNVQENIMDDEAPQPKEYLLAANGCGLVHQPGDNPIPRQKVLNSGLLLVKPSIDAFNYYMSILNIEGRFPSDIMDQNLLNYAHRANGNMPWQQIDFKWTVNRPDWNDLQTGIYTVHEKYWKCPDKRLKGVLQAVRFKMEGYFNLWERMQELKEKRSQ